jgi:hypothetical protein
MTGIDKVSQIPFRSKVMGESAVISVVMPVKNVGAWIQNIKKNNNLDMKVINSSS